jgi:deoxyribose-phosphate aldolase
MSIASYIDHTLLKQGCTLSEIEDICIEAIANEFATVCIPPAYVKQAKNILKETSVKVCTVIGFPLGYNTTQSKVDEINEAIKNGAEEIDIVHNVSAVKNGDWAYLEDEISKCMRLIISRNKLIEGINRLNKTTTPPILLKVIIESGILTDEEIVKCCEIYSKEYNTGLSNHTSVDFVKTSTGFASVGATVHAVELIKKNVPNTMGIKASGGIRNYMFMKQLIDAGATRIGCSAGVSIMKEYEEGVFCDMKAYTNFGKEEEKQNQY